MTLTTPPASAEFLLYQTEDGQTRLEVTFQGETGKNWGRVHIKTLKTQLRNFMTL